MGTKTGNTYLNQTDFGNNNNNNKMSEEKVESDEYKHFVTTTKLKNQEKKISNEQRPTSGRRRDRSKGGRRIRKEKNRLGIPLKDAINARGLSNVHKEHFLEIDSKITEDAIGGRNRRRRRQTMEKTLHDVMNATQNLSNLRIYESQQIILLEHDLNNWNQESVDDNKLDTNLSQDFGLSVDQDSLLNSKHGQFMEEEIKDRLVDDQDNQSDHDEKEDQEEDEDEDLDEDGVFNWPKEKLVSDRDIACMIDGDISSEDDGPIQEFNADDETTLSSVSLSAIFLDRENENLTKIPSDKTMLAVFGDDNRFTFKDGLIIFEENSCGSDTKHEDDDHHNRDAHPEKDEGAGLMGWVGWGLNGVSKLGSYRSNETDINDHSRHGSSYRKENQKQQPKYADYVGGPPPRPLRHFVPEIEQSETVFDARPPPIDEVILDETNGEFPEKLLKPRTGDKTEPSVGMTNLRRLRRMRRGRSNIT